MRLDLPPVLRLLAPDETPDLRRDFAAFCRAIMARGEPLPTYDWYLRAIERRPPPPRVLYADPEEGRRMAELEKAIGMPPIVAYEGEE